MDPKFLVQLGLRLTLDGTIDAVQVLLELLLGEPVNAYGLNPG